MQTCENFYILRATRYICVGLGFEEIFLFSKIWRLTLGPILIPIQWVLKLIHACHAVPLPCSDSALSFVKVRVVAGNIRTASPTV